MYRLILRHHRRHRHRPRLLATPKTMRGSSSRAHRGQIDLSSAGQLLLFPEQAVYEYNLHHGFYIQHWCSECVCVCLCHSLTLLATRAVPPNKPPHDERSKHICYARAAKTQQYIYITLCTDLLWWRLQQPFIIIIQSSPIIANKLYY